MAESQYDENIGDFNQSTHANEDYLEYCNKWRICRDCIEGGSYAVKTATGSLTGNAAGIPVVNNAGTTTTTTKVFNPYLPPNAWQRDPAHYEDYAAYLSRAVYFNYPGDTLSGQLGMLSQGEPTIELPKDLEFMRNMATANKDGLSQLQLRINRNQLEFGRYHTLVEPSKDSSKNPVFINEFRAEKYLRCYMKDSGGNPYLKFVLLDVSTMAFNMQTKIDEQIDQLLVLGLDVNGLYYQQIIKPAEWTGFDIDYPTAPVYPMVFNRPYNKIPFSAANVSNTVVTDYELPPLFDLCTEALKLFQNSADYYQTLYMGGQETLVIAGGKVDTSKLRVGAGAFIVLESPGMTAQYVGITGVALGAQKQAMDDLHKICQQKGVSLIDFQGNQSGVALQTVQGAQTASLQVISSTSGAMITEQLKYAAEWMGLSEKEIETIKYTPSQAFAESRIVAQEILQLWQAKMQGLPLSDNSFHKILKENGYTDKDYDSESAEMGDQKNDTMPESLEDNI